MRKTIGLIAIILAVTLFTAACGSATSASSTAAPAETAAATDASSPSADSASGVKGSAADGTLELTLEQLKQYDGQNGNPAYVAVDGVIYDMTNVPQWMSGKHNGFTAGNDLTNEIKTISPHGVSKLKLVPVVGKLVDG